MSILDAPLARLDGTRLADAPNEKGKTGDVQSNFDDTQIKTGSNLS